MAKKKHAKKAKSSPVEAVREALNGLIRAMEKPGNCVFYFVDVQWGTADSSEYSLSRRAELDSPDEPL